MPLKLARARKAIQRNLMPDTCILIDPGSPVQSDTGGWSDGAPVERTVICGYADQRRESGSERLRAGVQVSVAGDHLFRLPIGTLVATTTTIRFYERLYAVVDPGAPDHGLKLAHYVGCTEIPNAGATA